MEYLFKVLSKISELPDFRFYPICKATKLTYLAFADDLVIFFKRNERSITIVMGALQHFNEIIGVEANQEKSNIFIAGVDENTKDEIIRQTYFSLGTLSIRCLGLPLTSRK